LILLVDAGHIDENPCRRVKRLKEDNERVRFLTDDEEARLMKQIGDLEPLRSKAVAALGQKSKAGKWSQSVHQRKSGGPGDPPRRLKCRGF
jgi:hypothetical protein